MSQTAYFDSPWPGEDGGPERHQTPRRGAGLRLQSGERLRCTTRRTLMSTMTVLGAPGEVYLLTHSVLRAKLGLPTSACVELIEPHSLKTLRRSPRLRGGPMWPGGMAIHRNGDVLVVYGRYAHRLNRQCELLATFKCPVNAPYNSFVFLDNGLMVTKNLSDTEPARLTVLDPQTLTRAAPDTHGPQASIARLSATGNTVYVVGVRTLFRYHWNDRTQSLVLDADWSYDYIGSAGQSYGWDLVLDGHNAWFMDNGKHRYVHKMVGAGVNPTPNRLHRVSLRDARDHQSIEVCGLKGGSITNPPLVDFQRNIVLAYDSANRHLQAWRLCADTHTLTPLWQKTPFACASHMILYPDTGEVVINDYCHYGEEVVVLQIETGAEIARVRTGGIMQGVVFTGRPWAD